ncbi:protein of unknown function [Latilactobacillus sakei]|nr:hypothetical protein LSAJ18_180119 [Latilactobacillus sakei]SOB43803.1 hypothetical protein LSAJ112_260079 [Latilactobacillus sakei]SON65589.1 protein of unknown function [Latilactobacillus sakei]
MANKLAYSSNQRTSTSCVLANLKKILTRVLKVMKRRIKAAYAKKTINLLFTLRAVAFVIRASTGRFNRLSILL